MAEYPQVDLTVKVNVEKFKQEGDLAYKYAPFRNMQLPDGSLTNLNTKDLNFKLTNPVNIDVQPSYDGTVNLILNDDVNPPRIINSRFTTIEDKRFKIIDRNGDNDTNIYSADKFDLETRLFKNSHSIPYIDFLGLQEGGNLKAGNYSFYFKYIDADGNESDIIAESGIIPIHEGAINNPSSISGGVLDTNCNKIIKLKLSNLDTSNDYLNIYYLRSTGEDSFARIDHYVRILDRKIITNSELEITITGFENIIKINEDMLNVDYNIVTKVKTQAQVQNMLFFGNVDKPEVPYKELTDLSLRILPGISNDKGIGYLNDGYLPEGGDVEKCEYYNMKNVYYYTGYWNNELYRFGIVYIMKDDSLSPVFNIRGCDNLGSSSTKMKEFDFYQKGNPPIDVVDSEGFRLDENKQRIRNYIPISEDGFLKQGSAQFENHKGVVRIKADNELIGTINNSSIKTIKPLAIKFEISEDVITYIKKYAKGFFFVRQKRIPTILTQGLTIGVDKQSYLPCIKDSKGFLMESFIDSSRTLTSNKQRHRIDPKEFGQNCFFKGILSPEIVVNKRTFTGLFNNSELVISSGFFDNTKDYLDGATDNFKIDTYKCLKPLSKIYTKNRMVYIGDGNPLKSTGTQYFSAIAGMAEDVTKFKYFGKKNKETKAVNLIRGIFTSFVGCENELPPHKIVNIHIPGYSLGLMEEYFKVRFNSLSSYYSIGNRYDVEKISPSKIENGIKFLLPSDKIYTNVTLSNSKRYITEYRGDCFINTVTVRMNRNFQDSELPLNDEIIEVNTWKDNYKSPNDVNSKKDTAKINRGDVNAVEMGHWVTFKVCSTFNLALRSLDDSNSSERVLLGKARGFYPAQFKSSRCENKMPESELFNIGYSVTTSNKQYMEKPDVPYIKNIFDTRVMFSQKSVNDAFQNGYRVFQGLQYQDVTRQYGGIVKMFDWEGNLLIVFENGLAMLPVNEKALMSTETGESVAMYGAGVLPEKESPISVDYGSRWPESLLRTPSGLYGVDTEAKKIWHFGTEGFQIISDFKLGRFLNENINFDSDEHYPIIGLRNVKTHYDNFKGDVIFTFYDITRDKKVDFNLVYNERIDKWITRTSWTPISSANINNIFISMDREVSKEVALNAYSLANTEYSEGIVLNSNVYKKGLIGTMSLKKYDYYNDYTKTYSIEEGDPTKFEIINNELHGKLDNIEDSVTLKIKVELTKVVNGNVINAPYFADYVYVKPIGSYVFKKQFIYKHGFASLFNHIENPKPLKWYDRDDHKFEFEFIINENFQYQKIFNNLKIISNKTQADEIQAWVVGDGYEFDVSKYVPTHQPIRNIKTFGRIKGNAHYKENVWDIELKPFKHNNREVRLRDKYIKLRVIYSGQDPIIITALQTFYTISYA